MSIYDKYNNRVAGFYTDYETNKEKPYIRVSGVDFDLNNLVEKIAQGDNYLVKYNGIYKLDDIEKDGKREIVSTQIYKENGMTEKGRYFLFNEDKVNHLLGKDKNMELTVDDIGFDPNDTFDFEMNNSDNLCTISDYLWATDKLMEKAGFTKELEAKCNEYFKETDITFNEIDDLMVNFYYNDVIGNNVSDDIPSNYVECVIDIDNDEALETFLKNELGSLSFKLDLSNKELDMIQKQVENHYKEISGEDYKDYRNEVLQDFTSKETLDTIDIKSDKKDLKNKDNIIKE